MADSTAGISEPTPVGTAVAVIDTQGTITGWTAAAEELLGHSAAEVIGRSASLLMMPGLTARDLSEWAGRARVREPWSGTTELRGKDGKSVRATVEAFPLSGRGRTDWFVTATDIGTSDGRTHLLVLSEASKSIGTALDVMKTAQELADFAVPRLADYITVDLAESVPLGGEPIQRLTSPDQRVPVFRRAGAASIHPDMRESLWDVGDVVLVPPSSPFTHALSSRESYYEPVLDISPGTWVDQDPDRLRTIRATGMHSLVIVPLQARGTLLGEAVFVRNDNRMAFSLDDLLLFEELAGRAALSLDNARRFTRERAASLALQRNLLPRHLAGGEAIEVASRYLPADTHEGVGGDWFDAIHLPSGRIGLVVGDVVGHGINAAARMGQFRTVVRTLAELDLPPHELLARLDRLVVRLTEQDSGQDSGQDSAEGDGLGLWSQTMGGTCVYAVYDPATRICTMARAGHPPPAVVHPDGGVTFPDLPAGTPIGMGLTSYGSFSMELSEGSTIALYTDGLIESRDADLDEGLSRLGAALAHPEVPLEELCSEVIAAMTRTPRRESGVALPDSVMPQPSHDDIALLLARTHGHGHGPESGSPLRTTYRA
ncbi:SpoIIE family protein phosphatase [Streptomyces sp. NPDC059568]|uniref:SpoIIE family protein phosphatase n=1 Tax=Streptomyces sp. NPDC059568 TaxID=3346868 RepID=UPI0036B3E6D1